MQTPRLLLVPLLVLRLLALALGVGLLGCAARALPPEETATPITVEALLRAEAFYLYPEQMDQRLLIGSLDALEERFDSVRFDYEQGPAGLLTVADAQVQVPVEPGFDRERHRRVLGRALHFVSQHLQEKLEPDETLELIALRGALGALDRYSTVFSGRGTDDFKIRLSGQLQGIGSQIGRRDGQLIAIRVFPDSPAERGGLKDGDAILSVDGEPMQPLSVAEAVDRIRGEANTPVVLSVKRADETLELHITRGEVLVPSVETRMLDRRIGYARVFQVSRLTAEEFSEKAGGLGPLEGLVLDMRGNTGGSMQAATSLADQFLSRQLIMRVVGRDRAATSSQSRAIANPQVQFPIDTVILVDGQTASAAEIISGALAPLGSVTIVGQTTFGKGLIQQVMPLPDENLLKLTVAEYLLSEDRAIHGVGIVPDIVLYPVPETRLGDLAEVPAGAIPYIRHTGEDDTFPIELAQRMLEQGREQTLVELRARATGEIGEKLAPLGVRFVPVAELPADLPAPLEIESDALELVAGRTSALRIRVRNPNAFAVPEAWVAVSGAAEYLSNRIVSLGILPAGGVASGTIELTPPEGLSAAQHPVKLLVASGDRPLAARPLVLEVAAHAPLLTIEVERLAHEEIRVRLSNRGEHRTSAVVVSVPGASRVIEDVEPGAMQEVSLPLTAKPTNVSVALSGPWAMRRIDIPIPEQSVTVVPPELLVERGGLPGRPRVSLRASAPEGLREGWIRMDGQKQAYVAWNGSPDGSLDSPLADGEHDLTIKVETSSGVSLLDARHLP